MSDLDARLKLQRFINWKKKFKEDNGCEPTPYDIWCASKTKAQAIRVELQKPALHEAVCRDFYAGMCAAFAKPAQEEITDAERYQFAAKHCVLSGGGRFGWSIAPATKAEWDRYLDAAIRASKGEKT